MAEPEPRSTLSLATQVVALLAFYLYFSGWTYSHALRFHFGLSPSSIETPAYFYIVYAYDVFFTSAVGWLLFLAIAGGWFAVARLRFIPVAEVVIVFALATLPFPLISALATARADAVYAELRAGHARAVRIFSKDGVARDYSEELRSAADNGQLLLLEQAGSRVFVFTRPEADANGAFPRARLYSLPAADVIVSVTLEAPSR
jgi:hypothetical protein